MVFTAAAQLGRRYATRMLNIGLGLNVVEHIEHRIGQFDMATGWANQQLAG